MAFVPCFYWRGIEYQGAGYAVYIKFTGPIGPIVSRLIRDTIEVSTESPRGLQSIIHDFMTLAYHLLFGPVPVQIWIQNSIIVVVRDIILQPPLNH